MTAASLFARNRGLAVAISRAFYLPGSERQDVEQEAMIGLWVAARTWDPGRGVPFKPFAALVIRRRLVGCVQAALRGKHAILTDADREDVVLVAGDDPERVVIARDTLQRMVAAVAGLTPIEREALTLIANGEPYTQSKRLNNAAQRARRKLAA